MGGILDVRIVQQLLDAKENLLDANRGSPVFLLVENRKTNRARGENVWVKERRLKAAFRGRRWVIFLEEHLQLVEATFPETLEEKKKEV